MLRHTLCVCIRLLLWLTGAYHGKYNKVILLIRQDLLGDFLISGAYFEAYCNHFHPLGYRIILLHSSKTDILAQHLPWIDEHIAYDIQAHSLLKRFLFYRKLAKLRPEYAIRMSTQFGSDQESILACIYSGAKHKAISMMPPIVNSQAEGLTDYALPCPSSWKQRLTYKLFTKQQKLLLNNAWKHQGILSYFDIQTTSAPYTSVFQQEARLASTVTGKAIAPHARIPDYLPEAPIDIPQQNYYCIIPGSSNPAKRWSKENFAEVIQQLHQQHPQLCPVFCGVASEAILADEISQLLPPNLPTINLCGKTTLGQLISLLKKSQFVLSNDTGTAHLAALLKLPLIAIIGGGHYYTHFPIPEYPNVQTVSLENKKCFCCNWLCHKLASTGYPCVSHIPVLSVLNAIHLLYKFPLSNKHSAVNEQ